MSTPPPDTAPFRLRIGLRWRDMDMLGHLNQAVYHELLEDARGGFVVDRLGELSVFRAFVLARVELDYRHEVRKDHGYVDVEVRVGRVGEKSLTLEHDVLLPDGTVAAAGRTVLVGWDGEARGPRVLTDAERAALGR